MSIDYRKFEVNTKDRCILIATVKAIPTNMQHNTLCDYIRNDTETKCTLIIHVLNTDEFIQCDSFSPEFSSSDIKKLANKEGLVYPPDFNVEENKSENINESDDNF